MAIEKRLKAVSPKAFTADGTSDGKATLADTRGFKVKQIIILKSNTAGISTLEVKRVESKTVLYLGPIKSKIEDRTDISAYTVASGSTIEAHEQARSTIPEQEIERLTYEEEPTVARRSVLVDQYGDKYSTDNPVPVQLSDGSVNIGTVNAELEVFLTHEDNFPQPGEIHDSVRIGDGVEEMAVNPDGSINVVLSPTGNGTSVNLFNETLAVPASSSTNLITYIFPGDGALFKVEFGGTNIATYELLINSAVVARKRTWFNGPLCDSFDFQMGSFGYTTETGDVVELNVIHERSDPGDFEARIQAQLI